MASLTLEAQPIPLRKINGVFLVGNSRVPLDTIISAYNQGFTAEEIVMQFSAVALRDVYGVINYYLNARPEVDAYLESRRLLSQQVCAENELRFPPNGVRQKLLARLQHD